MKAAVDEALVTKVENAAEPLEERRQRVRPLRRRHRATSSQDTYEIGGSDPEFLDFEFTHTARVRGGGVLRGGGTARSTFGRPPRRGRVQRGLREQRVRRARARTSGSLRLPPIVAFISSILLFGLGLLALHWREKDEAAAEAPTETTPAPVPAKV